jgi:hypothetical protein
MAKVVKKTIKKVEKPMTPAMRKKKAMMMAKKMVKY